MIIFSNIREFVIIESIKMFYFLLLLPLICNNVFSEELPILKLAQGNVQGTIRKNLLGGTFYAFQGIPYAQPPIGSLRFKVNMINTISAQQKQ